MNATTGAEQSGYPKSAVIESGADANFGPGDDDARVESLVKNGVGYGTARKILRRRVEASQVPEDATIPEEPLDPRFVNIDPSAARQHFIDGAAASEQRRAEEQALREEQNRAAILELLQKSNRGSGVQ